MAKKFYLKAKSPLHLRFLTNEKQRVGCLYDASRKSNVCNPETSLTLRNNVRFQRYRNESLSRRVITIELGISRRHTDKIIHRCSLNLNRITLESRDSRDPSVIPVSLGGELQNLKRNLNRAWPPPPFLTTLVQLATTRWIHGIQLITGVHVYVAACNARTTFALKLQSVRQVATCHRLIVPIYLAVSARPLHPIGFHPSLLPLLPLSLSLSLVSASGRRSSIFPLRIEFEIRECFFVSFGFVLRETISQLIF